MPRAKEISKDSLITKGVPLSGHSLATTIQNQMISSNQQVQRRTHIQGKNAHQLTGETGRHDSSQAISTTIKVQAKVNGTCPMSQDIGATNLLKEDTRVILNSLAKTRNLLKVGQDPNWMAIRDRQSKIHLEIGKLYHLEERYMQNI